MLKEEFLNITIEQLLLRNKLSVRSFNACKNSGLINIGEILNYYNLGNNFLHIKNLGVSSNQELINLCKETNNYIINNFFDSNSEQYYSDIIQLKNEFILEKEDPFIKELSNKINSFNEYDFDFLQNYYEQCKSNLDTRSLNIIQQNYLKVTTFVEQVILDIDFSFKYLKNIGEKSEINLNQIKVLIEKKIIEISSKPKDEFLYESIKIKYNISGDILDKVVRFYTENNYIPYFYLLQERLLNDKSQKNIIFSKSYRIFENYNKQSLESIANSISLTRERVRQIKMASLKDFFSIKNQLLIKFDWTESYSFVSNRLILSTNSDFIKNEIQIKEDVKFSTPFILKIFSFIYSNIYNEYGDLNNQISDKYENTQWRRAYLIKNDLSKYFDFLCFKNDIQEIKTKNYYEDYIFNLNEYIEQSICWLQYDLTRKDEIINIATEILYEEFGLWLDTNGDITIKGDITKKPTEIVYDIIKANNKPMHIAQIFDEFKRLLPNHKYEYEDNLRSVIARNDKITYINRASTYTLKEWKHIKTGTIRDSIVEYLDLYDSPQNISDLINYILTLFPQSNISSVRTSIYDDKIRGFKFYEKDLLGLSSKIYSKDFIETEIKSKLIKTFEQRIKDFEEFIIENDHFPFSASENEEEKSLNRWWNFIVLGKRNLTIEEKDRIQQIIEKYSSYEINKKDFIWNQTYNKVRSFIIENKRLPKIGIKSEKYLYEWMYRTKTRFYDKSLTENQRNKFIQIAKLF